MQSVKERFLRYVQVLTTSDANSETCPSTAWQLDLAKLLVEEMKEIGIQDARLENGYVYGTIPAKGNHPEKIGLIAHMDTVDDVPGPTHPVVIENYDGNPITLKNGVVIDGFDFLKDLIGNELIVTSGDSILGGDDKAGIAEIMTLAEMLMAPDAPEHCTVCIGFTPDEEIGRGPDLFNVPDFGADFAYTVDGGKAGELEFENFNAASCFVTVKGVNIHPGTAKNQMKNSMLVAMEWSSMLPANETPSHTEGYEGFYHLTGISGDVEMTKMNWIIRDHIADSFAKRKQTVQDITDYLNKKYGEGTVELVVKDSYRNMLEIMQKHEDILDRARAAYRAVGIEPVSAPIRGGTDGATLSYMGLPCPNVGTGGYNAHGRKEMVSVDQMKQMVEVLKHIVCD